MFQEMRQHQEVVRQQMLQQSKMQQQMYTYLSGCIGILYRHSRLPEPELPTTQQIQYDPSAPPPPIGGYVQTPLASFPMSPVIQTLVFAAPAPNPVLDRAQQHSVMTEDQRAVFLEQ